MWSFTAPPSVRWNVLASGSRDWNYCLRWRRSRWKAALMKASCNIPLGISTIKWGGLTPPETIFLCTIFFLWGVLLEGGCCNYFFLCGGGGGGVDNSCKSDGLFLLEFLQVMSWWISSKGAFWSVIRFMATLFSDLIPCMRSFQLKKILKIQLIQNKAKSNTWNNENACCYQ